LSRQRQGLHRTGLKGGSTLDHESARTGKRVAQVMVDAVQVDPPGRAKTPQEPVERGGTYDQQTILRPGEALQSARRVAEQSGWLVLGAELDADEPAPETRRQFSLVIPRITGLSAWEERRAAVEYIADKGPIGHPHDARRLRSLHGEPGAGIEA